MNTARKHEGLNELQRICMQYIREFEESDDSVHALDLRANPIAPVIRPLLSEQQFKPVQAEQLQARAEAEAMAGLASTENTFFDNARQRQIEVAMQAVSDSLTAADQPTGEN